jgi:hypothetical protein
MLAFGTLAILVAGASIELVADAGGGGLAIGVVSAATLTLVFLLIPRRYEVWPNRLVLVFLWRRWQIPFESLEEARPANPLFGYGYLGLRFATAPSQSVEVRRVRSNLFRRPNLIISPGGREEFLRVLQQALDDYRRGWSTR